MKYWPEHTMFADGDSPHDVCEIAFAMIEALRAYGGDSPPRLLGVARSNEDVDLNVYELHIELAPGVVLPFEYGSHEGNQYEWESIDDTDAIIKEAMAGVEACLPRIEQLSDALHDVRQRTRVVLAQWARSGIPTRLVDVRLASYTIWRGQESPATVVLLDGHDDRLEHTIVELHVDDANALDAALAYARLNSARAWAKKTELNERGACATIDQFALNAISHLDDPASQLRRFSQETRFVLDDGTHMVMMGGDAFGSTALDGKIDIVGDYVTIRSLFLSSDRLEGAIGHPVTDLVKASILSQEQIVREAESCFIDGMPAVTVRVDVPKRLFCWFTGRVWDDDGTEATDSTIVPFRAKAS